LIRSQIHSPEAVVRQTFGECAALVGIKGVIAVVYVHRSGNRRILVSHSDAKIEGLRHPLTGRIYILGGSHGRTGKYTRRKLSDELASMRTLWDTISFDDHKVVLPFRPAILSLARPQKHT
jgi:hypothetical protein